MSDYNDFGFENANESHSHAYLLKPLIHLLGNSEDKTILDLGCGNGSLTRSLIGNGYNVYGTDASAKGIKLAQDLYPDRFALQNLESDLLPIKLQGVKFTTVISTEVIEHLYHPRKLIRFAKDVLINNGGGDLIISTPYHGYLKNLTISLAGKWDTHMPPEWDGGHIKMWSKATLTALLESEGFTVTHFKGCGRLPLLWKSMMLKASIG